MVILTPPPMLLHLSEYRAESPRMRRGNTKRDAIERLTVSVLFRPISPLQPNRSRQAALVCFIHDLLSHNLFTQASLRHSTVFTSISPLSRDSCLVASSHTLCQLFFAVVLRCNLLPVWWMLPTQSKPCSLDLLECVKIDFGYRFGFS